MAELDAAATTAPQTSNPRQIALEVRLRDDATLDNFLPSAATKPLLQTLANQLAPKGEPIIYLHGGQGTGKSHLLQAGAQIEGVQSLYLPLDQLCEFDPTEVFQGVAAFDRICLDNLQAVAGNSEWETALFSLYNEVTQCGGKLLVAADVAPRALPIMLEDLRSRLSWGIVFALPKGSDEEKAEILVFRAERRGMSLTPAVASFIVSRAPRAMAQLLALLDQLDQGSLEQKRTLSIPFVKQVLGW